MATTRPKEKPARDPEVVPAHIRLPQYGARCPYTGLTRSALDLLTRAQSANEFNPPVKSKVLRQSGTEAGIKLIDFRSLRDYLDNLPSGANPVRTRTYSRSTDLLHQSTYVKRRRARTHNQGQQRSL
jgi:hypothetical protein